MNDPRGATLVLAGTPIGNLDDAPPALRRELETADLIAAEDTRRARSLCARLGVQTAAPIVSYFDANEAERTPGLVERLLAGARVVLITDAGMPSVSDPGYRLVAACVAAGIRVTAVPGPSAVVTALAVSGLPVDRFCFEGFLPRTPGPRGRRLAELTGERRTMVFYEAPHRVKDFLADAARTLGGDRPAVVCRELTKTHEEIIRGTLDQLVEWADGEVRGEITIVIQGASEVGLGLDVAVDLVAQRTRDGEKMSSSVSEVAAVTGVNRKELYEAVLATRKASNTAKQAPRQEQLGEEQSRGE